MIFIEYRRCHSKIALFFYYRKGVVFDPSINKSSEELFLASSTISESDNPEDRVGIIISYSIKVTLFLSSLGGTVEAEIPFILVNQRPSIASMIISLGYAVD